jgi:uncharacterized membrane protein YczE
MKRVSSMHVIAVGAILLVGIWMAIYLDTRLQPAPEETLLVEIKGINTLRAQFDREAGKTRLILLLSPT